MVCPRCGSRNVLVQRQTRVRLKNAHHGLLWWVFIGWWWVFVKWICFTVPALIFKIFGHRKQRIVQTDYTLCVCQQCAHSWRP